MIIKAIVMDMDGLMIDSEPFWRQAEIEEFAKVGLHITEEMCYQTTGIRIDEVCQFWFRREPWQGPSPLEVSLKIRERVEELVREKGEPLTGVYETIDKVKSLGLPLALCSSSPMSLINTVLTKLNLTDSFDFKCSAEHESYGKPHPAVYLNVLNKLQTEAEYTMTFEDTLAGVISAKAASMKAVAVPQKEHSADPRFSLADFKLNNLLEFNWDVID